MNIDHELDIERIIVEAMIVFKPEHDLRIFLINRYDHVKCIISFFKARILLEMFGFELFTSLGAEMVRTPSQEMVEVTDSGLTPLGNK